VETARIVNPEDPSWVKNAASYWHSNAYGFGVVDAEAAVVLAETWRATMWDAGVPMEEIFVGCDQTALLLPDTAGARQAVSLSYAGGMTFMEGVAAVVDVDHSRRGDLGFVLTSPSGTASTFDPRRLDSSGSGIHDWPFFSVSVWGESPIGEWHLVVEDTVPGNGKSGMLNSWCLILYGH
jgi:hypothetical protein